MTFTPIPQHESSPGQPCPWLTSDPERGCYWCCPTCNYNRHQCPGCGTDLRHDGREFGGAEHEDCCA